MNIEYRSFNGWKDWEWIQQICPIVRCGDTSGIMAIDTDTDDIMGAFMMDNWTQNSVQCHFMIKNPLLLRHGFLEC